MCNNFIGFIFPRCRDCNEDLPALDSVYYCDYMCTHHLVNRLGLDQAMQRKDV